MTPEQRFVTNSRTGRYQDMSAPEDTHLTVEASRMVHCLADLAANLGKMIEKNQLTCTGENRKITQQILDVRRDLEQKVSKDPEGPDVEHLVVEALLATGRLYERLVDDVVASSSAPDAPVA